MAVHKRQPDFVASHVRLERRVSNLETGVHPTTAQTDYWDSYPLTSFENVSPYMNSGDGYWLRRVGMVFLYGSFAGLHFEYISGSGTKLGTLPVEARPSETTYHMIGLSLAPGFARLKIQSDGEMWVLPGTSSGPFTLSLTNVVYPYG